MNKIRLVVEIGEYYRDAIIRYRDGTYGAQLPFYVVNSALKAIAHGTPYNPSDDCISREQIRKSLNEAFGCENATKYGNQNAEQQNVSYSTLMLYEIADIVDDCCDNAQPVQPERSKGEWIKEDNGKTTDLYRCSICGRSILLCKNADLSKYPFCHCGADMRKGGAE